MHFMFFTVAWATPRVKNITVALNEYELVTTVILLFYIFNIMANFYYYYYLFITVLFLAQNLVKMKLMYFKFVLIH